MDKDRKSLLEKTQIKQKKLQSQKEKEEKKIKIKEILIRYEEKLTEQRRVCSFVFSHSFKMDKCKKCNCSIYNFIEFNTDYTGMHIQCSSCNSKKWAKRLDPELLIKNETQIEHEFSLYDINELKLRENQKDDDFINEVLSLSETIHGNLFEYLEFSYNLIKYETPSGNKKDGLYMVHNTYCSNVNSYKEIIERLSIQRDFELGIPIEIKTNNETIIGSLINNKPNKKLSKRKTITQDVKDKVWNRDGGECVECGSNENLEFDHIIPVAKGGSNTYRNLQLLCEPCNRSKRDNIG